MAGVFPASVQAAAVGSVTSVIGLLAYGLMSEDLLPDNLSLWSIPGLALLTLVIATMSTVFCAFYIALVGVPVAWLLGRRLDSPLGLAAAVGVALLMGAGTSRLFWSAPVFEQDWWIFTLMVMAHALPAGLFYRRAVIDARSLSLFAEPDTAD